jgi:hypothetical protein
MKRILIMAAALAAAVPATSSAGVASNEGEAVERGGQDLVITFTVRTVNGEPTKIKKFKFDNLTTTCDVGGPVDLSGRIGGFMKVNDKGKFDGKVSDGSAKVSVKGEVKQNGKKVEGTIRGKGDFPPAEGCNSGKVKWEAKEG